MPIGPHEGKELELMLAGTKFLAAFGDVVPADSSPIPEGIIPEGAFAPHVAAGTIRRFEKTFMSSKLKTRMHCVCFTLPGHEWRAEAYFWIRDMAHNEVFPSDDACDIMIGRLLGYDEESISHFISQSGSASSPCLFANRS